MVAMSPRRTPAGGDTARGTASAPPSLGFDAPWAHPLPGRLPRDQSRRQRLDRRHPWLLDTSVVLAVALISLPDLLLGSGNSPQSVERRTTPSAGEDVRDRLGHVDPVLVLACADVVLRSPSGAGPAGPGSPLGPASGTGRPRADSVLSPRKPPDWCCHSLA